MSLLHDYLDRIGSMSDNDNFECTKIYMLYYLYSNNDIRIAYLKDRIEEFTGPRYNNSIQKHRENVARLQRELSFRSNMLRDFLNRELELENNYIQ